METNEGPKSYTLQAERVIHVAWGLEGIVEEAEAFDGCEVTSLTITEEPS
jgi:hypothetical protein